MAHPCSYKIAFAAFLVVVLAIHTPVWAKGAKEPQGDLLFASARDGDFEIYRMDIYSKEIFPLTNNGFSDVDPIWASGGEEILFCSNRGGRYELFTMRADGSRVRRLFRHQGHVRRPAVSADGRWIALTVIDRGHTGEGLGEVHIISRTTLRMVAKTTSGWNSDDSVFDKRGSSLIFVSDQRGPKIYRIFLNQEGIPKDKEVLVRGDVRDLVSPQMGAKEGQIFYLSHGMVHGADLDFTLGKVLESHPHNPKGVRHEINEGLPAKGYIKDMVIGPTGDRVYVVNTASQFDLYLLSWGESRFTRLTTDPSDDLQPSLK